MKGKILIIGAGIAGKELLLELQKYPKRYHVVGFIDNDKTKIGRKISGVHVLGHVNKLGDMIRKYKVAEIFIAIPSAQGKTIREVIRKCQSEKVVYRIVPRILEIVQGQVRLRQVKEVQIEDLLGRAIVQSEQKNFVNEFSEKKILVTGAAGSIGSEICRQLIQFSPKLLVGLDRSESPTHDLELDLKRLSDKNNFKCLIGDIREYAELKKVVNTYKPDIVFHAAAYKHVPLMQRQPIEAIKNNILGTENVAKIALEEGVKKFVNISSDKAANPSNIMGATKLVGEKIIAEYNKRGNTKYSSVRFGNVLGSVGSVVPIFKKQIAQGGPVTVTDKEMTRFFMTIPEAVQLVLQASILGEGGETFVLDMGEQIKIDELAKLMIQLSGYIPEKDIQIKYVGVRPGEKISEQLTSKSEELENTSHKKIYKIKQNGINKILTNFKDIANRGEDEDAWEALRSFAPNLERIRTNIPLTQVNFRDEEINAVINVLKKGWITMGNETVNFEKEFAEYVGAKHAIAVNSATSALFLALKALGVGKGDEVIVPSFTFASSVSVIVHCGATPVFADINKEGFVMDQKSFEEVLTKKTKAVIPVHYGGNTSSIKTNLPIIEDSAHLIPKKGNNKKAFASCYSFYATKNITTGEGGMITVENDRVATWLKKARLHGLSRDAWKRYDPESNWKYSVEFPGYKCNTTDINSALGRVQLRRLHKFEERRKEVIKLYNQLLDLTNKGTHLYPILIKERNNFMKYMKENNVGCSFHFTPLHLEPAYKEFSKGKLPVTELVGSQVVTLPLDTVITNEEVRKVSNLVKAFH